MSHPKHAERLDKPSPRQTVLRLTPADHDAGEQAFKRTGKEPYGIEWTLKKILLTLGGSKTLGMLETTADATIQIITGAFSDHRVDDQQKQYIVDCVVAYQNKASESAIARNAHAK